MKKATIAGIGIAFAGKEGLSEAFAAPKILKGKDDRIVRLGFIAVEVWGASTVEECWDLVNIAEETGV